jgi:hypothetical protein
MPKNKKNKFRKGLSYSLLIIGLISILSALVLLNTQNEQFITDGSLVYLPNYVSIWCDRLPGELQISFSVNDKAESICGGDGTNGLNAYTPDGCYYTSYKGVYYKVVDRTTSCSSINWFNLFDSSIKATTINIPVKISDQQKICFNENQFGSIDVKAYATKYGLRINNANGKVIFSENCKLADNINKLDNIDYLPSLTDPINLLPSGKVDHYISGYSAVVNDKDVVNYNGKQIYIYAVGSYYPIEKSSDGFNYANSLNSIKDSKIICVPSQNPLCVGGTTIKKIEEQTCSMFNKPEGFVTVSSDKECSYDCIAGNLVTKECRAVTQCSGDTPVWSSAQGKCVGAGTPGADLKCTGIYELKNVGSYKTSFLWGLVKFGKIETPTCVLAAWFWPVILGSVLLVLGTLFIYFNRPQNQGAKRK